MSINNVFAALNSESVVGVYLTNEQVRIFCDQIEEEMTDESKYLGFSFNDKVEFIFVENDNSCNELIIRKNGKSHVHKIINSIYSEHFDAYVLTAVVKKKNEWKEVSHVVEIITE